jgi:hypothetical protein
VLDRSATRIQPSVDVFGLGATISYLLADRSAYAQAWNANPNKSPHALKDFNVTGRSKRLLAAMIAVSTMTSTFGATSAEISESQVLIA